jgi:nucleotide-binding universal stress UspA family protein
MTHLPHEDGGHDDVHGIAKREWTQMTNETSKGAHRGELRIVVGIDGSPCADQAVEFAAHEAARWGALLHVISAFEVSPNASWVVLPLVPYEETAAATVRTALSRIHDLEPDVVTKGEQVHGFAGHVLVEASKGASLLVVGSRGRGELASLILGSVSEHCLHHVDACPIVIVRLSAP